MATRRIAIRRRLRRGRQKSWTTPWSNGGVIELPHDSPREIGKASKLEYTKNGLVQAATDGKSLYEIERGLLDQLLTMGHHAMNAAKSLHGTGDSGAAYVAPKGQKLRRSAKP